MRALVFALHDYGDDRRSQRELARLFGDEHERLHTAMTPTHDAEQTTQVDLRRGSLIVNR